LTCQNATIVDNSTNAFTLTTTGAPTPYQYNPFGYTTSAVQSYSPSVNGGAVYFNGSTDYLAGPSNAAFALGTVFTVECWVYPTNTTNLFAIGALGIGWDSTTRFGISTVGVTWDIYTTTNLPQQNAWSHIAVVRTGTGANQTTVYINGINVAQGAWTPALTTTVVPYIASSASGAAPLSGYMSNARIVKGTAVYTSNFVPPLAPLTAVTNTQLLLNNTNAGIYDASMITDQITVGTAQSSTSVVKYGSTSMYFPGSSNLLVTQITPNLQARTGDFTVELWAYHTTTGAYAGYFWGGTSGLVLRKTNTETLELSQDGVGSVIVSSATIPANQWVYITATRSGTTVRIFINGTIVGTATSSADFNGTNPATIGSISNVAGYYMVGYLTDVRITKGYARYTANFTPPTQSLPTS
jgi:hypothetical protein